MKRALLLSLAAMAAMGMSAALPAGYQPEKVNYDVTYRWGFINKVAGHGTIETSCSSDGHFQGTLTGHSIPWGGRIYSVEDKLLVNFEGIAEAGLPTEKITYKLGRYYKPELSQANSFDFSNPATYWTTDGTGTLDASADTKEAVTITADMLSLFYYVKAIDFAQAAPGAKYNIKITNPDGTASGLTITYGGEQTVNVGPVEIPTYAIVFNYDYDGAPSAYPVHAWVSKEGRIPVIISAQLVIGHMEMIARL